MANTTGNAGTTLTISSKNYSSWSLRGWLLAKLSGLPFEETVMPIDDPGARNPISNGSSRSGASVSGNTAARFCSAQSRQPPTRCTRRS
ncbi:hypothetical protein R69919_04833 [Paraburkholderia gardini]|nr:hypothetical protein R69919_04833 [Paraburkholderia gardini]